MIILPEELHFIKKGQVWALTGDSDSGHSELLQRIQGNRIEHVGFRHHFKNLSNTSDFYYQQRFNSCDSEDALTVHEYLHSLQEMANSRQWTYGKLVSEFNLEPLLNEQLIKLSNGETKRLLIAAALIRDPLLLLLDHPLTGLDKRTREIFGDVLLSIAASGVQVIIASHPMDIPDSVTHVAVMKNGAIVHTCARRAFNLKDFDLVHESNLDLELLRDLLAGKNIPAYDSIVRMTDVNVEYDGRKILQHINWHIRQGEKWSVSGPNGAGKSTLLSLINADNPQAYANDIILFDRKRGSGESIWDIKKQTGFVSPELYQYFPGDSSCLHVVESGFFDTVGLFRPSDPQKELECIRWMKLLQVDKYAHLLFSMVPSSVQRLCLLARALIKNPALLILDEPTQGLDISQQQFFTALIDQICAMSNVTVIFVSHYEHHIPKSVDKYLRLENGKQLK